MKVALFGLGYVGTVMAACLTADGHDVVGIDAERHKVDALAAGRSPVQEPGMSELLGAAVRSGRLTATTDPDLALEAAHVALVCVGTPSAPNGALVTGHLEDVTASIADHLVAAGPRRRHLSVIYRSTMLPGTLETVLAPMLKTGLDTHDVGFCPEFLREGSALRDYYSPPVLVIGTTSDSVVRDIAELFARTAAEARVEPPAVAETLKYACNAFHAVKVTFANEMARICDAVDVDADEVMDLFVQDTTLNISPRYLRPGFAFGGSCLPKDIRALAHMAKWMDVDVPLLDSLLPSNAVHTRRAQDYVLEHGWRSVAILGLSFKSGTDDLRESPYVDLAEALIGRGIAVSVYDPHVTPSRLTGANKAYVFSRLPHFTRLLTEDVATAVAQADAVLLGSQPPSVIRDVELAGKPVVALSSPRRPAAAERACR
jgi:GDP-mannose 6-dehydrogenase